MYIYINIFLNIKKLKARNLYPFLIQYNKEIKYNDKNKIKNFSGLSRF